MSTVISDFLATIDAGVINFFQSGSASVAGALAGPFIDLIAISLILWIIASLRGLIHNPVMNGAWRILIIILITSAAFGSGVYNGRIARAVYALPGEVAAVVTKGDRKNTNLLIDEALTKGNEVAKAFNMQASGWKPGDALVWNATALIVWIFTGVVCAYAAAIIVLTKVGLGVLLALGPLFIILILFQPTRGIFDGWVRQLVTFVLMYVFVISSVHILFSMWNVTFDVAVKTASNGFAAFIPAFLVGVISFIVLTFSVMIARGIGGGWHMDTAGIFGRAWSMMTGTTGAVASSAFSAGKGVVGYSRAYRDRRAERSGAGGEQSGASQSRPVPGQRNKA
jgi:type IV secretion system protein VirB6